MLFNSVSYLIFLPVVFFLYWLLPGRFRTILLLAASCIFYMAFVPKYIFILFFLITVDYFLAQKIEPATGHRRRIYFVLSILSNVSMLFVFKYFNFFNENVAHIASALHWNYSFTALSIILPLGLSFHIFQSLAYIIEVYKGRFVPERNYLTYALYVMFFPQLVAGPIERPAHLLPQLNTVQSFRYEQVVAGLRQILWGLFKKVVIADNLGVAVDFMYRHLGSADSSVVLLALFLFPIQLYCDFSGYSDIAIGSAKLLGINLMNNFNRPFLSLSIEELWRRWHISLSTWFRDYVYYPIAWKTVPRGKAWIYASIILTFAIIGLWHGAGWKFPIMGLLFGLYICIELLTKNVWGSVVPRSLQRAVALFLASVAWVFFRAENARQGFFFIERLFTGWSSSAFRYLTCQDYCSAGLIGITKKELAVLFISFAVVMGYEILSEKKIVLAALGRYRAARWGAYYALILWTLLFGYFIPKTFIYFQF